MEEMIESCIPFMLEDGSCKSGEDARNALLKVIPNLKRWKSSQISSELRKNQINGVSLSFAGKLLLYAVVYENIYKFY